jgi:predicted acetyltransferase
MLEVARMAQIRADFLDPGDLRDGELRLVVAERIPAEPIKGYVPSYELAMMHVPSDECIGRIALRLGADEFLVKYAGQIGYDVAEPHRGHRYAARSCRLLLPLARAHGFTELWITCNPDNVASRRTCEILGAELVETVALPADCDMFAEGERFKCRFRLAL